MSDLIDDLRRYKRALETGDPDTQLFNPDDDVRIVGAAAARIEKLEAALRGIVEYVDCFGDNALICRDIADRGLDDE